ncbi:hypothetical protein CSA56_01110 [candidate division KSB3 bacterium]|uniref:Big-1 domain-containing protein n=1 Tax=candidate division KSB3 bacterium TaxID=2044937 RepID=A0A2G6KKK1_9BACT|nr:MAG: hypothetical protein CSA56_01110 [candidate division KSB3 bacterium]
MAQRHHHRTQADSNITRIWALVGSIFLITLLIGVPGCGKLSDDTDSPSEAIGTSGGNPFPVGTTSSVGTYSLAVTADRTSLPADRVNFATLTATLSDSSARSLQGYTVSFEAQTGNIGRFLDSTSGTLVTTEQQNTDTNGRATARLYGVYSGTEVVKVSVDLDRNGTHDLSRTVSVLFTPGGPPSSAGTYSLEIHAHPSVIPADMATYSVISATLKDSSGGSVENFMITFASELGYVNNTPTGISGEASTTTTAVTNKNGSASVYYYADRAGSATIQASVYVPDLAATLNAKTSVAVTESSGVPGSGIPGIDLSVNPTGAYLDLGTCGESTGEDQEFVFSATVWDETGDEVGSGVRVEYRGTGLSGSSKGWAYTADAGTATWSITKTIASAGTYEWSLTAYVTINGVEYSDTVVFGIVASCSAVLPELELRAEPNEIETNGTSTITAVATKDSAPLSGEVITFTTNFSGATVTSSATTNSAGVATATFTAGSTSGTATVYGAVSTSDGSANGSVNITITDAASTITASAPDATATLGSSTSTTVDFTVSATVQDASGDYIEGVTIGFAITPLAGCGAVTFDPTTGSDSSSVAGVAALSVTATATGTATCTYEVTATTGALSDTNTGTITVNP